jgi:TetR/AcrR family transcriptional regulator, mexJK operon transcriptional repressor
MNAPIPPRERARDAKRQAILEIARESFLTHGYAATSMSRIAAQVGGSKGTLYNHFGSKEELFEAMMQEECSSEAIAITTLSLDGEIDQVLCELGKRFVRFILSGRAVSIHRVVAAETGRFPELGRMFYEQGPKRTTAHVAAFLAARMAEGRMRRADPERAAQQLFALLKAGIHQMYLWGLEVEMTDAEIDTHVSHAVDTFLHGYAHD